MNRLVRMLATLGMGASIGACWDDDTCPTRGAGGASGESGLSAVVAGASGSAGAGPTLGTSVLADVDVLTWWVDGSEADAWSALVTVHEDSHPGVRPNALHEGDQSLQRGQVWEAFANKRAPDTFQVSIGADLLQWARTANNTPQIEPLQSVLTEEEQSRFFESVLGAASQDGDLYAVPLNIHRNNTLFYNKPLLDRHHILPPRTLEEFEEACRKLKEEKDSEQESDSAKPITPIVLGASGAWTLSLLVHENLLPAITDATYYQDLWDGKVEEPLDEDWGILAAYREIALWLANGWLNDDYTVLDWSGATARLLDKNKPAAFMIMGDWAKGQLEYLGYTPDVDFGASAFPGTAGTFVFTADCFPLVKGAKNFNGTVELLKTFASEEGQLAFSIEKGSIPALRDLALDSPKLDAMQHRTAEEFDGATARVLALSGLRKPDLLIDLDAMLVKMLADVAQMVELGTFNYDEPEVPDRGRRYWANQYSSWLTQSRKLGP